MFETCKIRAYSATPTANVHVSQGDTSTPLPAQGGGMLSQWARAAFTFPHHPSMGDMQEALWGLHGPSGSPKLLPITPSMALPPPTAACNLRALSPSLQNRESFHTDSS